MANLKDQGISITLEYNGEGSVCKVFRNGVLIFDGVDLGHTLLEPGKPRENGADLTAAHQAGYERGVLAGIEEAGGGHCATCQCRGTECRDTECKRVWGHSGGHSATRDEGFE